MRNSTKMGGSVKKKYQTGGSTGYMKPTKKVMTKTGPDSYDKAIAKNKAAMEAIIKKEGVRKAVEKAKTPMPKKQSGGVIPASPVMTSPIQGRTGRRPIAGGNMANGGSLKPVNSMANPGLAKLPTPVRNKMGYAKKGGTKYQAGGKVTDSRTKKGLADGKMSKGILDYSAREIAEGIYNTEKANAKGAYNTVKGAAEGFYNKAKTNAGKEYDDLKKVGNSIYNEAKRKAGQASDAFDAGYNLLFKKKGGTVKNPGFKAVQSKIAAKQGISKASAGAILAASTRKASAKAKAANPRLRRVKG
jgi:hypothetical protein